MRAAVGLQQNAVLERLLAVVLTVRKCHSGEAFVRLKVRGLKHVHGLWPVGAARNGPPA